MFLVGLLRIESNEERDREMKGRVKRETGKKRDKGGMAGDVMVQRENSERPQVKPCHGIIIVLYYSLRFIKILTSNENYKFQAQSVQKK